VVKIGKLLINEPPLIVLPTLAEKIGLNEAIVIQQIHYWLQKSGHVINGKRWIYNSYPEWQKQFPFWTERTIRRIMKSLIDQGLISIDNFNKYKSDKTNWYTINYEKVKLLRTSCPYGQDNLSPSIPETNTDKKKYANRVIDRQDKEIVLRQREIALNRWIEEGKDPNEFSY
jgi:hypothetical protein